MNAEQFARLLRGRREAKGKWTAFCPAHGDRHRPSLRIAEGKKGVLIKCMSNGCTTAQILDAMGLKLRDLFYNGPTYIAPPPPPPERLKVAGRVWHETPAGALAHALACAELLAWPEVQRGAWMPFWSKENGSIPDPHAFITGEWDRRPADGYTIHPFVRTETLEGEIRRAVISWWRLRAWDHDGRVYQRAVKKYGADGAWERWERTEAGKRARAKWGIDERGDK